MHSGLLWYDQSTKSLPDKVKDATTRYLAKFGIPANIAYVNPDDLMQFATGRDPLTYKMPCLVVPSKTILRNNVWVGVSE